MSAQAYLRCMGQPVLTSASGQTIRFRTKKHLALLTYLVVEEQRQHRRERLAELLWPKVGVSEGRHSLATALSILRARLGPESIMATREHVTFAPEGLATDLDRLIRGEVVNEAEQPLEVAGFLEGFDIPDAMEFGLWKDRQQARLLPFITKALRELVDHCRRIGDTRRIELLADRMLALDELSEEAIRAKMEARALAGDRLTALRIYEAWEQKLAAELKAVPSAVVEGMAIRLRRRGWERTALANIPTVPTDQWKGRSFYGRSKEYRLLYDAWKQAQSGRTLHPFVRGDSGVGKTTLVERFTTSAGLEGAAVTRVQCYGLDHDVPYATLCSLVRGLLDLPGVSGTPPESLAELSRIVPEICRRFPGLPTSSENVGETARIRFSECFHDVLMAVVDEHPLIVVVDDLHLSDESSLAVLHLAMRKSVGRPLMVIMIARPHEVISRSQASRFLESGGSLRIAEIECPPLSPHESHDALLALSADDATPPPPSVKRAIVTAAAGFPMVLELLYQDWHQHGGNSLALGLRGHTPELPGASSPPQFYREVLSRLVRSMDPVTQAVLNLASILGPRLNDMTYYRLADLTVGQTLMGLTALASRRVLRDGGKGLEFVNELLRTSAYLGVPSPLRRSLHSSIADQLMKAERRSGDSSELEIAWHCVRAGRQDEATRYLLSGAREAIRAGAAESAERALTTALPSMTGADLTHASLLLAEVLQEQGRHEEVLKLVSSIKELEDSPQQERAIALEALAFRFVAPSTTSLRDWVAPLTNVAARSTDISTRALAARALAYLLLELRDLSLMRDFLKTLDNIPAGGMDVDAAGHLALARALLLYQLGDREGSFAEATAASAELRRRGAANLLMLQLECGVGSIQLARGDYDAALSSFEEGVRMANRLGNDSQVGNIAGNLALCCGRLGKYEEQLEWTSVARKWPGAERDSFREIQLAYSEALASAMLGRPDDALRVVSEMDTRLQPAGANWRTRAWKLWKADILRLAGKPSDAVKTAFATVSDLTFDVQVPTFAGPFARWLYLSRSCGAPEAVDLKLAEMGRNLHRFDTLDQTEILCVLRLQMGERFPGDLWVQLECNLHRLPAAVLDQLTRLGALTMS